MAHSLRPTCSFGACDNSACTELIPFREVTPVIYGGKTTLAEVGRCGGWWRGDVQLLKVDDNFQSLVPRESRPVTKASHAVSPRWKSAGCPDLELRLATLCRAVTETKEHHVLEQRPWRKISLREFFPVDVMSPHLWISAHCTYHSLKWQLCRGLEGETQPRWTCIVPPRWVPILGMPCFHFMCTLEPRKEDS